MDVTDEGSTEGTGAGGRVTAAGASADARKPGGGPGDAAAGASMTIDELARRSGMTVRNIRAHQSRGLVPPPEVRGRTGFYGAEHLARIELIRELQADGFNLEAIRRLLEGTSGSSREVLGFTRALREPFEEDEPQILGLDEIAGVWGREEADPSLLARAEKLGVIRPVGDGRVEVVSPRLLEAGRELGRLGVPPERGIEVLTKLRRNAQSVARTFTELFIEAVWQPFDRAGRPEDEWPQVRESLERLRPLASEALLAVFQMTMTEVVEETFGRELKRETREPQARKPRRRSPRRSRRRP
jgi:DNA-binding transcriptional MerR regulator